MIIIRVRNQICVSVSEIIIIWNDLKLSGMIWNDLELSGIIWNDLE
jgi:hypothetical protein